MIVITLLINVEVVLRFFFDLPLDAISEIVLILFPWLTLLGAAVAIKTDGANVTLYLIERFLSDRQRRILRALVGLAISGFGLFLIVQGGRYTQMAHGELTNVLSISRSWEILPFPISGALFILYSLRVFVMPRRWKTAGIEVKGA